jgi:hypothetical protein
MLRSDVSWEGGGYYGTCCLECRNRFSTKRRDALYCGATCRKKANRRKRSVLHDAEHCCEIIRQLDRMRNERPDLLSETNQAIRMIREEMGIRVAQRVTDRYDLPQT